MHKLLELAAQEQFRLLQVNKILYSQWLNQQVTQELRKVLLRNQESLRRRLEEAVDTELHDLALRSAINTEIIEVLFEIRPDIEVNHPRLTSKH